jgi:hypothetical protein
VVCVYAKDMREPWCLAASDPEPTAVLVNNRAHQARPATFGERLCPGTVSLLGAVGESLGMIGC